MVGTMRQLVNNMVLGVTKGFEKKLILIGVGYKAQAQGNRLNLAVGYSHPVNKDMPDGIVVTTPTPTEILIKGADRQRVGPVSYTHLDVYKRQVITFGYLSFRWQLLVLVLISILLLRLLVRC